MSIVIIYIFLGVWGQFQMGYIQNKLHSIVLFKKQWILSMSWLNLYH